MIKIAVFASGTGTNFVALYDHIKQSQLPIEITRVICDQPKAAVLDRARERQIPIWTHRLKEFAGKEAYEQAILTQVQADNAQLLVLAGYMRIVTQVLLNAYAGKIINIHPALLPSFPGRHGIEDAFDYGVKVTGVTVHYVDSGVDSGPVIAQQPVAILPEDSVESLAMKIHDVEHELYFESLCQVLRDQGLLTVQDNG